MKHEEPLAKILSEQFEKIEIRLNTIEQKISVLALANNLVDFCKCHIPAMSTMLEGMPCCSHCEKVIKDLINKIS